MRVYGMLKCVWVLLLLGCVARGSAQTGARTIHGIVDASIDISSVKLTYCDTFFSASYFWNEAPAIEREVTGGAFSFELPAIEGYRYVKLDFSGRDKRTGSLRRLSDCIFFVRGDGGAEIQLSGDTCLFGGAGRTLLEIQYRIGTLKQRYDAAYRAAVDSLQHEEGYERYLSEIKHVDSLVLKDINAAVDAVPDLSPLEKRVVKLNAQYDLESAFITNLIFQSSLGQFAANEQVRSAIRDFYTHAYTAGGHNALPQGWPYSRSYIGALYLRALADLAIPLQADDPAARVAFDRLYEHITGQYDGPVLDRLLVAAFQRFGTSREIPSRYYEDALSLISDAGSARVIRELAGVRMIGTPGYGFRLPDTAGHQVDFTRFRGKVVVMDFWFTGCHGCLSLAKAMKPVHEHFAADTDVVFINVSTDVRRQSWIRSVRSGKYSHAGSINVYTDGQGTGHEIIRHYKIAAYPTLIIFDKGGKVAYFNPRGPFSETDRSRFISRIERLK